ncbi:MAG: cytochrome-c oxidase, cbb3-type subunit III [Pseudochelatococcus sp.]|jgi:cytochrome c oxidase cbb3-type subunit 3|uniref:cytochrome-c oxidase, cbb3-type subunit III n=1 Tax=Pseudochelatococcus sp. TaxID=2020869 RepID=UPI003D91AB27
MAQIDANSTGHAPQVDAVTGVTTTGHEWDGIQELNNPLPRWWLWVFYATIVWSVGFWIAYPAWPLISSFTPGLLGWSSRGQVAEHLGDLREQRGAMMARLDDATTAQIEADPELLTFARALGRPAFGDNCAPCHGAGGGGAKGYPNLNDDAWLWGGTLADIEQTIRFGIRSGHDEARVGDMPAFGRDGMIPRADIITVADYVRSLSGLPVENRGNLATGAKVFADNCASCHGADGTGNRELGAPNLTTGIWLFGPERETIIDGVWHGRGSVMPAWQDRLDDTTIKALTVFVHTLGGGE